MMMGGGASSATSSAALSAAISSHGHAAAGASGRMAKYASPATDGAYTAAHHAAYRHCGWVKVSRLNRLLTEGDVATVFSQFGEVLDVRLATRDTDGQPTGFAYVEFLSPVAAAIACDVMNSSPLGNIAAAAAASAANEAARRLMGGESSAPLPTTALPSSAPYAHPSTAAAKPSSSSSSSAIGGSSAGAANAAPQPFLCRLLPTDAVGIEVDHCDVAEVPKLKEGQEGYGHWFHRVFVGAS